MASVTVQASYVLICLLIMSYLTVDLIQTVNYEDRSVGSIMEIAYDVT